jgi:transaldolase/glucose-6-phosphate isomerase
MDAYAASGSLPAEAPLFEEDGIALFADARNAAELAKLAAGPRLEAWLAAHLGRLGADDYAGFLAYIPQDDATTQALQAMRLAVRDRYRTATCTGFGPRYLHSTGQAHKGGPNSGVFLQITAEDADDLAVPQQRYSFGTVKAAQARGDLDVLAERGRRVLRVHLRGDLARGLERLVTAIGRAAG